MSIATNPKVEAAFSKARALIGMYGEGDPRSMLAMIKAVNLADSEYVEQAMAECGLIAPVVSAHRIQ